MKNFILSALLLFLCLSANAQLGFFSEIAINPIKADNPSVVKNLSLGLNYQLKNDLVLRSGLNTFDVRSGTSVDAFVDIIVAGQFPVFGNSQLQHLFDIHATSVFVGLQKDIGRFSFNVDVHQAFGKLKNSRIAVEEPSIIFMNPETRLFDANYENIFFNKVSFSLGYEILKKEYGSVFLLARYSQDLINNEDALVVSDYDPELMPFISSLPGSNPMTISEFLKGGDIFHDTTMLFLGVQVNYIFNKESIQ